MNRQSNRRPVVLGMYSAHTPKTRTVSGTMKRAAERATRSPSSGYQTVQRCFTYGSKVGTSPFRLSL